MKIHRDFILDRLRLIRVLKFFFILYSSSNPQPIGFRGNLLVKRQKFFYCTYSLGITETSQTQNPLTP